MDPMLKSEIEKALEITQRVMGSWQCGETEGQMLREEEAHSAPTVAPEQ